jgi:DnaJ-class molecular chaperone
MDEVMTNQGGRSAGDIVEGGAGGEFCRALNLVELDSAAYAVEEEFAYETGQPAEDLLRLVRDLRGHLARLGVRESDAALTLDRECRRCSGHGSVQVGPDALADCDACTGTGVQRFDAP